MQTLIALLRGINMTGHNSLKMKDLSKLFTDMGFSNVETYIQSGNVIFSSPENLVESEISDLLKKAILERFGYSVPVIIRTIQELKRVLIVNKFPSEELFDKTKMAVIFLNDLPSEAKIQDLSVIDTSPERYEISGREIFIYCPAGFGKSKLYSNFFDKKLGVVGTGRNWNTVNAILEMASKRQS
jgi:uncharacterized protein (DUF1697 family)